MQARTVVILENSNPSFHSDQGFDNYEGFDAYRIATMPVYYNAPIVNSKKKEIVYL